MSLTLKKYAGFLLSGIVLVLGGCLETPQPPVDDPQAQHPYSADIGKQIEVRKNVQFADIPAPMEFGLDKNKTKTFQGSSMRFGVLIYKGIWNVWETNQWYIKNMTDAGWKLIDTEFEDDYHVKNYFKKLREIAVVDISDNKEENLTDVTIWLNDKEQEILFKEKSLAKGDIAK